MVFRGAPTGNVPADATNIEMAKNQRLHLAMRAADGAIPGLDAGVTGTVQMPPKVARAIKKRGLDRETLQPEEMVRARGILDVNGNTNSWQGCFWKLASNSVVLKVAGSFEQWYYDRLVPWRHFAPVAADLSDLARATAFVLNASRDAELEAMAAASTSLARKLLSR